MELYNVNDEEYRNYLKGLCLANLPVPFYNKKLQHILVDEVFIVGEERFYELLLPFKITVEMFVQEDIDTSSIKIFDILFPSLDDRNEYNENCLIMLKLIFATENITLLEMPNDNGKINGKETHVEIVIDNSLYINRDKFEELRDIILEMCYTKKILKKDLDKTNTEKRLTYEQIMKIKDTRERNYQLAIYEKNKKEEKKNKKTLSFYSIYNYICHSNSFVNYKEPLKFNLYQFFNTYFTLNKSEKYRYDMRILSSGMVSDIKKMDTRWFSERIIEENRA